MQKLTFTVETTQGMLLIEIRLYGTDQYNIRTHCPYRHVIFLKYFLSAAIKS
jgi:hypothetical protein